MRLSIAAEIKNNILNREKKMHFSFVFDSRPSITHSTQHKIYIMPIKLDYYQHRHYSNCKKNISFILLVLNSKQFTSRADIESIKNNQILDRERGKKPRKSK